MAPEKATRPRCIRGTDIPAAASHVGGLLRLGLCWDPTVLLYWLMWLTEQQLAEKSVVPRTRTNVEQSLGPHVTCLKGCAQALYVQAVGSSSEQ
jgi:hypothetical protein